MFVAVGLAVDGNRLERVHRHGLAAVARELKRLALGELVLRGGAVCDGDLGPRRSVVGVIGLRDNQLAGSGFGEEVNGGVLGAGVEGPPCMGFRVSAWAATERVMVARAAARMMLEIEFMAGS
jgi:hypothetical protein